MSESWKIAGIVARRVCLVPTGPNVRTIETALLFAVELSGHSLQEVAEAIVRTALEDRARYRNVDRFWFEDARWLYPKLSAAESRAQRTSANVRAAMERKAASQSEATA